MDNQVEFWTILIAAYGAIVATGSLVWNILREVTDKGRLSISAMIGRFLGAPTSDDHFVLTITNVGKRPLMVKGYGGYLRGYWRHRKAFFVVSRGLPKMLTPTEHHIEWSDELGKILDAKVGRVCVWDSLGREFNLSRRHLRRLQREYANSRR